MMMGKLRSAASHIAVKIIFVLIILSFLLGGIGGYLTSSGGGYVAKVNGQKIDKARFDSEVQNLSSRYGLGSLSEDEREASINLLRQNLLDNQINDILMSQYRDKLGLQVNDSAVKSAIFNTPDFQIDGVFDNKTFQETLARSGYTPDSYAAALRSFLSRTQLAQSFVSTDFVLPFDSKAAAVINQKRTIYVAMISPSKALSKDSVSVSDDEIQAYYNQHKESMTELEKVKVDFLYVSKDDLRGKVKVSDADIAEYYKHHPDEFIQPERFEYSSIQVKTEQEAEDILKQLKGKAKFADLAKEKSMYAYSRDNKGSLGRFTASDMPEEIKNANLTKRGQISAIMPFSDGFTIFRLDNIQPKREIKLEFASNDIKKKLIEQKTDKLFEDIQHKMQDAVVNSDSLEAGSKIEHVELRHTGWFNANDLPYGFDDPQVKQAIFNGGLFDENGSTGINSDVIVDNSGRAFVFHVVDHKNAGIQDLKTAKPEIEKILEKQKTTSLMQEKAQEILAELNNGNKEALEQYGASFAKRYVLSHDSREPNVALVNAVFNTARNPHDNQTYGFSLDNNNDAQFFVIVGIADTDADVSDRINANIYHMDELSLGAGLREEGDIKIEKP